MKVISFCIWGNNPKYTIGAIKNADLAKIYYPDWRCIIYCANTVPHEIIKSLSERENVILRLIDTPGDWRFTTYRFLPMSEDIEMMISRDTDSRIGPREVEAVNEWINSGKSAHIMRDHPYHGGFPMLAGMFGIKGNIISSVSSMFALMNVNEQYHFDQIFLQRYIFPFIEKDVVVHDEFFQINHFPSKRIGLEFVGKAFNADDSECNPEHSLLVKDK